MRTTPRPTLILSSYLSQGHARVGRVLLVVLAGAGLQLMMQALIARTLTKTEVGVVSLLLGALPILSTLSLFGQDSATVRFLSRSPSGTYDARSHVNRVMAVVVPLAVLAGVAGAWFYGLGAGLGATLVVLILSQNAVTIVTSVMRAAHRYELAMAGVRMPAMAAAVVMLFLRLTDALTLRSSVVALGLAFGLSALCIFVAGRRGLDVGDGTVPRSVMGEGVLFFGLGISFAFMIAIDKLIIGKMMTYADLAIYASIFAVMRGFDFLFYSISYVLMPRVNRIHRLKLKRINLSIAGLAAVVTAGYLLLGDDVVRLLYEGKYDVGSYLILPFALSGIAKLFYSVPSSVIGARLPRTALKQFMWFNLAGMVLNVALDIALILRMGLAGAALATAASWGLRLGGGYVILWLNRAHLDAAEAPVETA